MLDARRSFNEYQESRITSKKTLKMAYLSYRDLDIYKKAYELAVEIHRMTIEDLPKFEIYEEGSQIRQSSKSIATNIAEGFGRKRYKQEFIRFLTYSLASCDETRNHLDFLRDTVSLKNKAWYTSLTEKYDHLGKMINNFIKSVDYSHIAK
jgi:four helix bundle protein